MKYFKRILGALLVAIVPVLAITSVVSAQRFSNTIEEGQTVHGSVYSSGKNVQIKGEIFGDVICAGQNITVEATVHGDVICIGQDITVGGKVDGDIRLAGQIVTVEGEIGKNASVAAMSFSLDAQAKIGQDISAVSDDLSIKGSVGRDAVASGSNVTFNGPIGRNISVQSENVQLKEQAAVAGNLTYTASKAPKLSEGAAVKGKTTEVKPQKEDSGFSLINPLYYVMALLSLVIVGVVLAWLFPQLFRRTTEDINISLWKVLLTGIVASVAVPTLGVLLAITVVGVPLTVIFLLAMLFGALLSGPVVGYWLGTQLLRNSNSVPLIAAVGGTVVVSLYFIPFIGFIIMMLAFWTGFGAVLRQFWAQTSFASK